MQQLWHRTMNSQWEPCRVDGCRRMASWKGTNRRGENIWACSAPHRFITTNANACVELSRFQPDDERSTKARATDPQTSHDAANSIRDIAARQQRLIINELQASGPMTADEIDVAVFSGRHTAARRLPELAKQGLVTRSPSKRPTRSGRAAHIWRAIS